MMYQAEILTCRQDITFLLKWIEPSACSMNDVESIEASNAFVGSHFITDPYSSDI